MSILRAPPLPYKSGALVVAEVVSDFRLIASTEAGPVRRGDGAGGARVDR